MNLPRAHTLNIRMPYYKLWHYNSYWQLWMIGLWMSITVWGSMLHTLILLRPVTLSPIGSYCLLMASNQSYLSGLKSFWMIAHNVQWCLSVYISHQWTTSRICSWPLLFLLFYYDLPNHVLSPAGIKIFADDIKLYLAYMDPQTIPVCNVCKMCVSGIRHVLYTSTLIYGLSKELLNQFNT